MEGTFLCLEEQPVHPESLKHQSYMLTMVSLVLGVCQDVIDLDKDEVLEVLPEHLVHEVLEYGRGVDQAIWHDPVLVVPNRCHKRCPPSVFK